mgnify:FL=1
MGRALPYLYASTKRGRKIRYYVPRECDECAPRPQCTHNRHGRRIWRWVDEDLLDDMARQVQAKPDKVRRRKSIIEQPFGTVKHSMNQGYFLTRGLPNVRSEMSLTVLA